VTFRNENSGSTVQYFCYDCYLLTILPLLAALSQAAGPRRAFFDTVADAIFFLRKSRTIPRPVGGDECGAWVREMLEGALGGILSAAY
jgi:hypothetical protein